MSANILTIDDDTSDRRRLTAILKEEGHNVTAISGEEEIFTDLENQDISVMIIDPHLSERDGLEVIRKAKEVSSITKIIILTKEGTMESAIRAIQLGVHDYLLKAASEQEILSSVASAIGLYKLRMRKRLLFEQMQESLWQLKLLEGISEVVTQQRKTVKLPHDIQADLEQRKLWQGDQEISLTRYQGKLFRLFIENWNQVMTHEEMAHAIFGEHVDPHEAPEMLRPLICRLRKRLSKLGGTEDWIRSVRSTGYVFEAKWPND
jgi:DNA-binding response OmpR family regulator